MRRIAKTGAGMLSLMILVSAVPAWAAERVSFTRTTVVPGSADRYIAAVKEGLEGAPQAKGGFYRDLKDPDVFYRWESLPEQAGKGGVVAGEWVKDTEVIRLTPYRETAAAEKAAAKPAEAQNLIVVFEPKEQLREEFLSEFDKVIAEAGKAPGNLSFRLYRAEDRPGVFVLIERWENAADYAAHLARPYVRDFYKHFDAVMETRVRYSGKDLLQ